MGGLKNWWYKCSLRDRRAMTVLMVVLPVILFWYLVTVPLQERLQVARRVLATRRDQAAEVQKLLQKYRFLESQLEGVEFKADDTVVAELEKAFNRLKATDTRPLLNRSNVVIFSTRQPAARVQLKEALPTTLWETLSAISSTGVYLSQFELQAANKKNRFNLNLKAWLPKTRK
jgi:hypothetical protein